MHIQHPLQQSRIIANTGFHLVRQHAEVYLQTFSAQTKRA